MDDAPRAKTLEKRSRFAYAAKLGATAILLYLLFARVDASSFFQALGKARMSGVLLALLIAIVAWILNTLRWRSLLRAAGVRIGAKRLFFYNMASIFYATVLPGGKVMGDAVRGYQTARNHGAYREGQQKIFLLSFADRAIGLLGDIAVIGVLCLIGGSAVASLGAPLRILGILLLAGAALGVMLMFSPVFDGALRLMSEARIRFFARPADAVLKSLEACRRDRAELLLSFVFSVAGVFASAFWLFALAQGLDINLPYSTVLLFHAFSVLLIMIPLTIGGIGLREGGLAYLFIGAGIDAPHAVALSVLNLFILILLAAFGGVLEFYYHFLAGTEHVRETGGI